MKQLNNETAQQVKEKCFEDVLLVIGTYGNANKINFHSVFCVCVTFIYLGKSVKNKFLFTMTAQTLLGQLCDSLWDSQSRPDVIQPGFEPGTVVTPLALRCSTLDRCIHVCVLPIYMC